MSLTHVIPPEACSALVQLYHCHLVETSIDEKLRSTSFSYLMDVPAPDAPHKTVSVVPRININHLEYLYRSIEDDFKANEAATIATLYSAGLGLPLDLRLAAYWKCFSVFEQPVQDDIHITLDDVMHVLAAHINRAKRHSWGGRYAYQQNVTKHFKRFARYNFRADISEAVEAAKDLGTKKVFVQNRPKKGREGFIVYRHSEGQYRLYSAMIKTEHNYAPFIRQVMDSKIPTTLDKSHLKSHGVYLVVTGFFTFKSSIDDIIIHPGTREDIWDDCLDQDLFSHSDFKPEKTNAIVKSEEFIAKYGSKVPIAKLFIKRNKKATDKKSVKKLKQANALLTEYQNQQNLVEEFTEINRGWNKLNPAKHLDFCAYDMFFEDPRDGFKQINSCYTNIVKKLEQCGYKVPKTELVKVTSKLQKELTKRSLVRIDNNTNKINIHCLWFGE